MRGATNEKPRKLAQKSKVASLIAVRESLSEVLHGERTKFLELKKMAKLVFKNHRIWCGKVGNLINNGGNEFLEFYRDCEGQLDFNFPRLILKNKIKEVIMESE